MSEFNFDDEIEASNTVDFKNYINCQFLADTRDCTNYVENVNGSIVAIDKVGDVIVYKYARPAIPRILIDGINYPCSKMQAARIAEIKKELDVQYKIITGEV